jgi:hypothetical protein
MRGFLGGMMVVIGVLMVGLCGLCTAVFAIGSLVDLAQGHSGGEFSAGSLLQAALTLGLPPIAVGALLIWGGLRLQRKPKPTLGEFDE